MMSGNDILLKEYLMEELFRYTRGTSQMMYERAEEDEPPTQRDIYEFIGGARAILEVLHDRGLITTDDYISRREGIKNLGDMEEARHKPAIK